MYSFVGRRSTTAETTAAAAAHLGVTTYTSSLMFVLFTFLRVLYNIHHHVAFARELEEQEKNTEQDQPSVRSAVAAAAAAAAAAAEVRFSMTCRFVDRQAKRGNVHRLYRQSCRSLSLMLSCLTVSFSCGVVYSCGNRTPESEKKRTSAYLIKRKMKKKVLYTYQVRVYPCLLYTSPSPRDLSTSRMPSSA